MKNNNNLPKQGWCVNNDDSKIFKDTVIKYLNTLDQRDFKYLILGNHIGGNYGVNHLGKIDYPGQKEFTGRIYNDGSISSFGPNAVQLSIDEFIKLTSENMEDKKIVGYNVKEEFNDHFNILFNKSSYIKIDIDSTLYFELKRAKVLDIWCDPVFEEETYVGWYIVKVGDSEWLTKLNGKKFKPYVEGYHYDCFIKIDNGTFIEDSYKESNTYFPVNKIKGKATDEDILRILSITAQSKGFKEGINVITTCGFEMAINSNKFHLRDIHNFFVMDGSSIFDLETCKWAEIIKVELPTINNKNGRIEGEFVVYNNCAKFDIKFFRDLVQINTDTSFSQRQNRRIEKIVLDTDVEITMKQIRQIVEAFDNLKK